MLAYITGYDKIISPWLQHKYHYYAATGSLFMLRHQFPALSSIYSDHVDIVTLKVQALYQPYTPYAWKAAVFYLFIS